MVEDHHIVLSESGHWSSRGCFGCQRTAQDKKAHATFVAITFSLHLASLYIYDRTSIGMLCICISMAELIISSPYVAKDQCEGSASPLPTVATTVLW